MVFLVFIHDFVFLSQAKFHEFRDTIFIQWLVDVCDVHVECVTNVVAIMSTVYQEEQRTHV